MRIILIHEDHFPKGNAQMGPAESLEGRSLGDDFIIKNGYRMYHLVPKTVAPTGIEPVSNV